MKKYSFLGTFLRDAYPVGLGWGPRSQFVCFCFLSFSGVSGAQAGLETPGYMASALPKNDTSPEIWRAGEMKASLAWEIYHFLQRWWREQEAARNSLGFVE